MIFLDELKPLVLYKKPFHLPINEKDKKRGNVSFLLTPNYKSSIDIMNNPLLVNNRYYESYYVEKDITYFINQEGYLEDISDESYRDVLNEDNRIFISKKLDSINEATNNNLYFLSQDNMDNKTLTPRVPDNFLTKNNFEDNKTSRVCFSTSISKCLTALSMNCKDKEFYVHAPIGNHETYTPTTKEVPDRNITGEVWIKDKVKIQCIGKILVTGDDGKPGMKYKYGDNKEAELYGWDWKWIEKYSINESYIFSEKDKIYNLESFENKDTKIMFILGLSGSGKSTVAKELAKEYDAEYLELDMVQHACKKKYGAKFSARNNPKFVSDEYIRIIQEKTKNGKRVIAEGTAVLNIDFDFVKDQCIYLKNTSYTKSTSRAIKRQLEPEYIERFGLTFHPVYFAKQNIKIYDSIELFKERLEEYYSNINEASNEVLNDPKRHARSLKMKMNKAKYALNKLGDNERNNVGVEKDSDLNSNNPTPGAASSNPIQVPTIEKPVNESYDVTDSYYYGKPCKSITVNKAYTKGEVIDVEDSLLGRSLHGPCRDGYNVALVDGKFIATENISKGSNLFSNEPSPLLESNIETVSEANVFRKEKDINGNITLYSNKNLKEKDMLIGKDTSLVPHYIKKGKNANVRLMDTYYLSMRPISKGEELILLDESVYIGSNPSEYVIENSHIRCKVNGRDVILAFNENLNEEILNEANVNSTKLHNLLYKERFKNNKDIFNIHDKVKEDVPYIRKTYLDYERYNRENLFIDLSFYNQTFFKNNIYTLDKGVELYFEFINRFINDKRLDKAGYNKKTVFVPIEAWSKKDVSVYRFNEDINPISIIVRLMRNNAALLSKWKDIDFVFLTSKGYFKIDLSTIDNSTITRFIANIEKLRKGESIEDLDNNTESKKAIVANIVNKIEDSQKIKINNLTGDSEEIDKDELVKKIEKAASTSASTDEAIDELEKDSYIKNIIASLASEEDDTVKINNARTARINKLNDEFLNKKLNGISVRDMIEDSKSEEELPIKDVQVDSVNEEWKNLQYINFEEVYDPQEDILAMLYSLSEKTVPVMVRDINIVDSSNSEDMIYTYTVQMEDVNGGRFTVKFDIPKLKDNKFMRLRGNDKTFNGQLTQIPVSKTDEDTVQVVSNYKKIFISRFGTTTGKSYVVADRIIKTLRKMETKQVKIHNGDNSKVCSKYQLPIDYIDLATEYSSLQFGDYEILFNQDDIRSKYNIDDKKGIPVGINVKDKSIIYYKDTDYGTFSDFLYVILNTSSKEFNEIYETTSTSTRYTYSKASILNNNIPVVVIMGYNEGLVKSLKKANIRYEFVEKRPKVNKNMQDIIKFKDGFLVYDLDYNSSLLMNGLKQCNTEDYSIGEVNDKSTWLDFLDLFGGKILADGLDNFYDLMIDPITKEVLEYYKLPTDYVEILAYANYLLSDNKYFRHTDMDARRYRSNEIIAGYTYQALADSYGDYRTQLKKSKKGTMTMKQSIVIDKLLLDPTTSDFSILNPLLEIEAINSVTYKGLVGMNADRAYSLDKRTFDDTMVNVLGLSTGFAGNVGITRQATMDMNIKGKRGYIKTTGNVDDMSITKTFTATEALTPFGSRHDDPFRSAMTFIQTAKHGMRVKNAMPSLISNGADQALPYMITNTFAYKAKQDGKIIEKTDDYMIIKHKDGSNDYVDLRERVQKNSDGGFYLTLKLDSDYKVGNIVKKGEVIAYDKSSFSDVVGHTDNIAYNVGTLAKIAILNTDEGFEDSAIISDWLSDAMTSDIVIQKDVTLPKNTNIYNMVKKGQPIQEGEPLMIFQNAFDEEDVNMLLKNLVDDEDAISDLGRIPIKSKITGVVEDVKILRTVEKDELSDSLRKKVNELEKPISDMKKIMKKYDIESHDRFEADYKLDQIGKMKNVHEGVLVEFYLKYEDKMSVGDKVIYYSALKGVVKDIFPIDKEPYTDTRPDEKIHSLLSLGSVNGRMVTSVMLVGAINKVLIELDRSVKDMLGIPFKYLDEE